MSGLTWTEGQQECEEQEGEFKEDDEPDEGELDSRAASIGCLQEAECFVSLGCAPWAVESQKETDMSCAYLVKKMLLVVCIRLCCERKIEAHFTCVHTNKTD